VAKGLREMRLDLPVQGRYRLRSGPPTLIARKKAMNLGIGLEVPTVSPAPCGGRVPGGCRRDLQKRRRSRFHPKT
jgi:hypothetical protein